MSDFKSLFKDEYILLQQFYEDVDRRCLTIKNWSITVGLAAIGAGLTLSGILLLGAFASSLVFWYLEAFWRGLHYFLAVRIKQIEKIFRDGSYKSETPFQIYRTWSDAFKKEGPKTWEYLKKTVSRMPHLFIAIVSLILFITWVAGFDFKTFAPVFD